MRCNWKATFKVTLLLVFAVFTLCSASWGATYYVDSVSGRDSNNGTSQSTPWKSLSKVNGRTFQAGDQILFKCGRTWTDNLTVNNSGTQSAPITFGKYSTGNNPIIKNTASWGDAIDINGSRVIIDGFFIKAAKECGVYIAANGSNNIVRNCEITNTGIGVQLAGTYNTINNNYIHDLHMIVNDTQPDNDYGAVGVWLSNGDNEVSYNDIINCKASSYDYGKDGGAFEFYGNTIDNVLIIGNYCSGNNGVIEMGN